MPQHAYVGDGLATAEIWIDRLRPSVAVTSRSQIAPAAAVGLWTVRFAQPPEHATGLHGPLVTSILDKRGPLVALVTIVIGMPGRHSGTLVAVAQEAASVGGPPVELQVAAALPIQAVGVTAPFGPRKSLHMQSFWQQMDPFVNGIPQV
jgi:hypothetical protein